METAPQRRQTRQRRLVYETVAETVSHPTAEWVYERVRRRIAWNAAAAISMALFACS